jgi:hypothetical protein
MARQYRVLRKVQTVPVAAGGFVLIDLPRAYDVEAIFLRINGQLQVTGAATSVRAEAPCQAVQRVTVIADGKNNLFSAPFWFASLGRYDRALPEQGARATTPPTGAGVATYTVEAIGVIDCMTVDGVRPKDSNFRTSRLALFQLQLQFGQPGDSFVGGTVTFGTGLFVDVYTQELVEGVAADGEVTTPFALKKVSYQEIALPASNANQEIRLPAGNLIKSCFVRTEGSVTAGEPSVAMLNNLQLVSGVDVRVNLSGPQLRAKNNADHGQLLAGYYVADVTAKGDNLAALTELWDVTGQAEPKLVLDVVGGANNRLQAVVTEYILAAAAG